MKFNSFILICLMSVLTFSCTDNTINDMGVGIQPTEDKITVYADTFHVNSENCFVDYFTARPDSFLLGTYYDSKFGTTQADIFAQVEPPLNYALPKGAVADSAKVIMYYTTWFGHQYSPMEVNIYEMNKGTFEYTKPYLSNLSVSDYTDKTQLIGKRIFSAKDPVLVRKDTTSVVFNLSTDFVTRFSGIMSNKYTSTKDFLKKFNGLYITTDFGTASMLYINQIDMIYYYHYKYANANGSDSTTVNLSITFPANSLVRQVNRVSHPDKELMKQNLLAKPELTYISSPANVYTRVSLPLKKMKDRMTVGNKMLTINSAVTKFNIEDFKNDTVDRKNANYLLLIKESAFKDFFENKELPSDTSAILAKIAYEYDNNDALNYYYSFSLASLVANEFKKKSNLPDNLNFLLVPVSISYDSSGNVKELKQQNLMNSVTLCSGKHATKPLNISVVYSGF